jgi:hypothetical protein
LKDRELLMSALRDGGQKLREAVISKIAGQDPDFMDKGSLAFAASKPLSGDAAVSLAKTLLSYATRHRDGAKEVAQSFTDLLSKSDLSPTQQNAILEAAKGAKTDSLEWRALLMRLLEKDSHETTKRTALETLIAATKLSKAVDLDFIRQLARVASSEGEANYGLAPMALTALGELGILNEEVKRALEASAKSEDAQRQALAFEVARKLRVKSPLLMARAKEILSKSARTGRGVLKEPAEYLVSQSPILGGFFLSNRVKEMKNNYTVHIIKDSGLMKSDIRRAAFIARSSDFSSSLCKDFMRALHPMAAQSLTERALNTSGFRRFSARAPLEPDISSTR